MKERASARRLLLDLNVLLDVVLDRAEADKAARLWALLETGRGQGFVPAHGVTTIFYLVARAQGPDFARRAVDALISVFSVAPVDGNVLRRALALNWPDFEDAVCAAAAEACSCDAIVTRDPRGFRGSPVSVIDTATAVAFVGAE
jgi:predicted nucleic acid-binding protein